MQINFEFVIYIVIFLAVLMLVQGIYLLAFGKSISLNSRVNRRLALLEKGHGREVVLEQLRKEMTQHLRSRSVPLYSILADKAQKANIAFSPQQLVIVMVGLSAVVFLFLSVASGAALALKIVLSVAMGVGAVFVWVNRLAKKRMSMIEEQLPDAIELIVRSLRVGHPFSSAVNIVAKEVPDPLGTEMGVIADEAAYGREMGEALKNMAERIDTQDMRFFAVAVSIQAQSGGNLAEILDGLSKVIRARFRLFRRVKAITAEARWAGTFLSAFPIGALIMINVIKPDYFDKVRETSLFIPASIGVAFFLIANVFVMRALTNIKV
ncbi:MAG: type II secretion system F family protein [Deltaproteobacteria bacterium]